jgi:hypothetical protein
MNDFKNHKMHFTLALLAVLFALHPFFSYFDKVSFPYMGVDLPLSWAFIAAGVLLALAVYCYATDMVSESSASLSQRLGNYFYAIAVMVLPCYGGLYLSTLLEDFLVQTRWVEQHAGSTPYITIGLLVAWLVVWQLSALAIRRYLTRRDWTNKIDHLTDREMDTLKRARDMMDACHYDLAIIQSYKAVLLRLEMACLKRGYPAGNPLANARKAGIISGANEGLLKVIVANNDVATSTTPVKPEAARETADATQRLLATIPV